MLDLGSITAVALDAGGLDEFAEFGEFRFQNLAKLLGRAAGNHGSFRARRFLHLGQLQDGVDLPGSGDRRCTAVCAWAGQANQHYVVINFIGAHRHGYRVLRQSARKPASRITLPHLAISDFTNAANSLGVLGMNCAPSFASRGSTSGSRMMCMILALSLP